MTYKQSTPPLLKLFSSLWTKRREERPLSAILEERQIGREPQRRRFSPSLCAGWLSLLLAVCAIPFIIHEERALRKIQKLVKHVHRPPQIAIPLLGGAPTPRELYNIPSAETSGLVLDTTTVALHGITAPYNASILEEGSHFLLFFRYDLLRGGRAHGHFDSYIGMAELDRHFQQIGSETRVIDTHSRHAEDPRAVRVGGQLYLFYNDIHPSNPHRRSMRVSHLLPDGTADSWTHLDLNLQPVEKNWAPFEYIGADGQPMLRLEYNIHPHTILELPNPQLNQLSNMIFPNFDLPDRLPWSEIWGTPRGGAGARKIGDQYLSFFHSSFQDENHIVWYVMGAYTFESEPPFRITGVSHHPILFEGIYETPPLNTANPRLRCIFPCAFALGESHGRKLIHLACGENDSAVKIVTIDQELLLQSLKKISYDL